MRKCKYSRLCRNKVKPGTTYCRKHLDMKSAVLHKYAIEHKKKGLCTHCSEKAAKGKTLCIRHLEKVLSISRKRQAKFKKSGICRHCGVKKTIKNRTRCLRCSKHVKQVARKRKISILIYYGKNGKLKCCWRGCSITDPDMLSIDHIKDDGARDRRDNGHNIYCRLIREGFPSGFQTLCYNHQWKKVMLSYEKK